MSRKSREYSLKKCPTVLDRLFVTFYQVCGSLNSMIFNLLTPVHNPLLIIPFLLMFVVLWTLLPIRLLLPAIPTPITLHKYYNFAVDASIEKMCPPPTYTDLYRKAPYYFLNLRLGPDNNMIRAAELATRHGLVDARGNWCYGKWLNILGKDILSEVETTLLSDHLFNRPGGEPTICFALGGYYLSTALIPSVHRSEVLIYSVAKKFYSRGKKASGVLDFVTLTTIFIWSLFLLSFKFIVGFSHFFYRIYE